MTQPSPELHETAFTVSVIIPVYKAAPYVRQAVQSALVQPETAEVILIEDASPDDSLRVCEALAAEHDEVTLLRHPDGGNHGVSASRNLGLAHASQPYIAFLDADDFFLPGRFERARAIFAQRPEVDGVYETVGFHFEDEAARQRWLSFAGRDVHAYTPGREVPPGELFAGFVRGDVASFSTIGFTVKRALIERTGPFDAPLRLHEDKTLWIKMAALGCLVAGRLDQPVALARFHADNTYSQLRDRHASVRNYERVWLTLWQWGQTHLNAEQQALLTWRLLDFHKRGYRHYSLSNTIERAAAAVIRFFHARLRLLNLARRYPALLRSAAFWRQWLNPSTPPYQWD